LANGVTATYTYNAGGLLTSLINRNPSGVISSYTYTYFLDGNQATILDHTGRLIEFWYDNQNRLVSETEQRPDGNVIVRSYTFDNAGNRGSKTIVENGVTTVTTYTYDLNNRLTRIHERNLQTQALRITNITYDANGNQLTTMTGVTGGVGGVLEPRLGMSVLASNETPGRYEHFQAELEGSLTGDGISRLFVRVATQTDRDNLSDQPEGTTSDRETPEPHLHMMVLGNERSADGGVHSSRYTFDLFNRLIRVDRPGLRVEYAYRADGMRISKTVNGEVTRHIWDGLNIVADVEADGTVIDTYIRGGGLIRSWVHGYYVFNARGDVVQITNAIGWVIRDYEYDAFGIQLGNGSNEPDTNPWRFTGEYFDIETGMIYLRHRFYNPLTGRFITEDPYWNVGNMRENANAIRQAINLYAYTLNNPIMWVDPSGLRIRLAGTPAARDTLLSYLQLLTEHRLGVDSDRFVYISSIHESVENFPAGNTLITRVIASEHIVEINLMHGNTPNSFAPNSLGDASDPRVGSGGRVNFNPSLNVYTYTASPRTGLAILASRPSEIGLAHELIHGDRAQRGVIIPLFRTATVNIQVARAPLSPARLFGNAERTVPHRGIPQEELATIGIRDDSGRNFNIGQPNNITENMIRTERELALRLSHLGVLR